MQDVRGLKAWRGSSLIYKNQQRTACILLPKYGIIDMFEMPFTVFRQYILLWDVSKAWALLRYNMFKTGGAQL